MITGEDLELFARSLRAATEAHTGEALDVAVAELGWDDALSFDTRAAVSTLFELQGEACARSSALDRVVAFALGRELDDDTAVVMPAIGRHRHPGHGCDRARVGDLSTCVVSGCRCDRRRGIARDAARSPGSTPISAWSRCTAHLRRPTPRRSTGTRRCSSRSSRSPTSSSGCRARRWRWRGEHALERIQFDQPIAKFQAVRHRLADTLVAIETASAVLDAAWLEPTAVTAAMAKATAGRGARVAAKHCQQVLAGIGFTTEHDLPPLPAADLGCSTSCSDRARCSPSISANSSSHPRAPPTPAALERFGVATPR